MQSEVPAIIDIYLMLKSYIENKAIAEGHSGNRAHMLSLALQEWAAEIHDNLVKEELRMNRINEHTSMFLRNQAL